MFPERLCEVTPSQNSIWKQGGERKAEQLIFCFLAISSLFYRVLTSLKVPPSSRFQGWTWSLGHPVGRPGGLALLLGTVCNLVASEGCSDGSSKNFMTGRTLVLGHWSCSGKEVRLC